MLAARCANIAPAQSQVELALFPWLGGSSWENTLSLSTLKHWRNTGLEQARKQKRGGRAAVRHGGWSRFLSSRSIRVVHV